MNRSLTISAIIIGIAALVFGVRHDIRSVHGQITKPATTGMVAPMASGAGTPGSILACNASSANIPFWNTVTNVLSGCNGASWIDLEIPQVQSDWNAVSGLGVVLNKPTITAGTVTGVTATAPIASSGGSAPVISCSTCAVRLTGTTGSIGGSLLAVGGCSSGTASVTGAVVGTTFQATPSDGSFIGGNYTLNANVATTGVVTVNICAVVLGTPPSKTYNVSY